MISDLNIVILVKTAKEASFYQDYGLHAIYTDRSTIWPYECEGREIAVSSYPGKEAQTFRDKIVKRLRGIPCKLCLMKPFRFQDTPYSSILTYVERLRLNNECSEDEIRSCLSSYVLDTGEPLELNEDMNKKKAQADILIDLGLENNKSLFMDQYKEPFAQIIVGDHREIYPVASTEFRRWLSGLYFTQEGRACNAEALRAACDTLAANAMYQGSGEYRLQPRTAWHEGALYYDLCDPQWKAVRITPSGWEVMRDVGILFRRFKNQATQVAPILGGKVDNVLEFLNLKNPNDRILFLAWLIAAFIPDIPHPVLNLHGTQGSAKTTCSRDIKKIVDPGIRLVESMQKDETDLIRKLHNSWFIAFDNLHNLQQWQSDTLSRAVTGDGFSTRTLYTNNDEFILQFQRVILLNGINLVVVSPDLLDRSIIIELERISPEKRLTEDELERAFAAAMPGILGGVFDVLVKALHLYPKIKDKLKSLPRMADFAVWGYAIADAMGEQGEAFLQAYHDNIWKQHQQVIENHPIAAVLLRFMADRDEPWTGRAGDLLEALEKIAGYLSIKTNQTPWPQQPNTLMRRLNELKATMMECGIAITTWHTKYGTSLIIEKISPLSPLSPPDLKISASTGDDIPGDSHNIATLSSPDKPRPQASPNASDASDDIFPLSAEEKKRRKEIRARYIDL